MIPALERIQVQVREDDVPAFYPRRVAEPAALEVTLHRQRVALVDAVEVALLVCGRRCERLEPREDLGNGARVAHPRPTPARDDPRFDATRPSNPNNTAVRTQAT